MTLLTVRRALISVSDKRDLAMFVSTLHRSGVDILSTGGTHKAIKDADISVTEVAQYTGFPEIMDGRVKTLHPRIHGGILGRRSLDDELMKDYGIEPIDLVVVNLYPFESTVERDDCDREMAIENIDIGGPAMIRSAAKNHADVLVIVDRTTTLKWPIGFWKAPLILRFANGWRRKRFDIPPVTMPL